MSSGEAHDGILLDLGPGAGPPDEAALACVPVFPLADGILFPHALVPLHIFETRYRKMTRDALAGNHLIVLANTRTPHEAAREAFEPVAGLGEIVLAEKLSGGRFNIVLRGVARVRVVEELARPEPYRLARVELVPDDDADATELADADGALRALVRQLADALPEGGGVLRQVMAAQDTPTALVDVMAASLVADADRRQRLLETTDPLRRYEKVSNDVVALRERMGGTPARPHRRDLAN